MGEDGTGNDGGTPCVGAGDGVAGWLDNAGRFCWAGVGSPVG